MEVFKDCITKSGLCHLRTSGDTFTWNNGRVDGGLVNKKLDRCLVNCHWLVTFNMSEVQVLGKGLSDHNPLLVKMHLETPKINKPFQFFTFMSELDGFMDVIGNAWGNYVGGDPFFILGQKLKLVKQGLIDLNKKQGNLTSNVSLARSDLKKTQHLQSHDLENVDLIKLARSQGLVLSNAILLEEKMLRQKSRVTWLKEGDGNSAFFFNQTKLNWNTNKILSIKDNSGTILHSHLNVANVAVQHFKNQLGTEFNLDMPQDLRLPIVTSAMGDILTAPVTEDLIWQTVQTMKRSKALGPDGFPVEFFMSTWNIVGKDFCSAIQHFFLTGIIPRGFNSTYIALILKIKTPACMNDFRPISLCTIVYKCISKILSSRLKLIMSSLVNKAQSAFIPGRSISDNILLAQELFRGYGRKHSSSRCALKLDLQKAFDSVS